jgi:nicotinamide-nucleotide amidase
MPRSEAESLVEALLSKGLRMSAAESCTGGLLGAEITSIPGASAVFLGSAVTYSNESKMSVLGVRESTLEAHGAVSTDTAREMAKGSVRAYGSDVAVSITGIAGPGGGTDEKPVGTVCMAVSDGEREVATKFNFKGDRSSVREQSVSEACRLLQQFVEGEL